MYLLSEQPAVITAASMTKHAILSFWLDSRIRPVSENMNANHSEITMRIMSNASSASGGMLVTRGVLVIMTKYTATDAMQKTTSPSIFAL